MNPLIKYKTYHQNIMNICIHQICVPLLLMSFYSVVPLYMSISINAFYSVTYLLFDVFSTKSIHSVYYLQTLFLFHFVLKHFLSLQTNVGIHFGSWILQIIGHKYFENNTPAFLDNLSDSFLFAPYFTFLEGFYPSSFEKKNKNKYTILKNDYDKTKKSIVYFAGLFQKAQVEYSDISNDASLSSFNHIFINTNFENNDIYSYTLNQIMQDLVEIETNIECVVGFSFGGSLSLQFKQLYFNAHNKDIKTVLVSPAGFQSNLFVEKTIKSVSEYLYSLYCNDKWYMIKNYPTYQNTNLLNETDYVIVSTSDTIHNPNPILSHQNSIILKNVSHSEILNVMQKQNIISQLIKKDYNPESVTIKPLGSNLNKLIFGGHFYPYHMSIWLGVSFYNTYWFFKNSYSYDYLVWGFLLASSSWTLAEYIAHRLMLHKILYKHHIKHHQLPNKLSIIHTPLIMGIFNIVAYKFMLKLLLSEPLFTSYFIFVPYNYLSFELTHLLTHSYKGTNKIILNAKYYHKLHHINEYVNFCFVTSFWDYVFGTLSDKYEVSFIELIFGFIPFYSFLVRKAPDS
jgi:uncharacterized membrane protein YGL010W